MSRFTFIDLFSGIGGFRMAFERLGGECVMSCEIDKFARKTYAANFSTDHYFPENIRDVPAADVPAHDVLLGGFPCQSFSIAGLARRRWKSMSDGLADAKQGNLFFEILRILDHHRPSAFLLENVPHIRRIDDGKAYMMILESLRSLGYQVDCQVLNAGYWVPQRRNRLFFVGHYGASEFRWANFKLPRGTKPVLGSILHPEDGTEPPEPPYTLDGGKVNPKYTFSVDRWNNLIERLNANPNINFYPHIGGDDEQAVTLCATYDKYQGGTGSLVSTWRPYIKSKAEQSTVLTARYTAVMSNTLLEQGSSPPRAFTPRECARLMGFDKPRGSDFVIPVSDAQAYKQFGNAVVVPCVAAIAQAMMTDDAVDGDYLDDNLPLF